MDKREKSEKITHIEFGFENVEGARFDARIIKDGALGKIEESIFLQGDTVSKFATADTVDLRFTDDMFNKENVNLESMHFRDNEEEALEDLKNHFTLFNDIVDIKFIYEDGSEETITVPWPGDDPTVNHGTRFYKDKNGFYVLSISNTLETEDKPGRTE